MVDVISALLYSLTLPLLDAVYALQIAHQELYSHFISLLVMKNGVWMLRRVAFVRNDVSEELSASIIKVTRISDPENLRRSISTHHASVASYG
jgi:hypothetical protein